MSNFSGFRHMWMIVMFDLPVISKKQRKRATRFRADLLDLGFRMSQYSVYMKFSGTREATNSLSGRVEKLVPNHGAVTILTLTDKQYGTMKVIRGHHDDPANTERKQLLLL